MFTRPRPLYTSLFARKAEETNEKKATDTQQQQQKTKTKTKNTKNTVKAGELVNTCLKN